MKIFTTSAQTPLDRLASATAVVVVMSAGAVMSGCAPDRASSADTHPRWELGEEARPIPTSSPPSELNEKAAALESAVEEWSRGTLTGSRQEAFGMPTDAAVRGDRVYILDRGYTEIRAFTTDSGRFVRTIGREGAGPVEFQNPRTIDWVEGREALAVATSPGLKLLSVADSAVELRELVSTSPDLPSPWDVCAVGSTLLTQSPNLTGTEHVVFRVGSDGTVSGTFATGYEFGSRLIRSQLSRGPLACSSAPPRVLTAFKFTPVVRGYTPGGEHIWTSYLSTFDRREWEVRTRDGRQSVGVDRNDPGHHIQSLTSLGNGHLLLQVMKLGASLEDRPGYQPVQEIETYVLSAETGAGVHVSSELPQVIAADTARFWAVDANDAGVIRVMQFRYRNQG